MWSSSFILEGNLRFHMQYSTIVPLDTEYTNSIRDTVNLNTAIRFTPAVFLSLQ